VRFICPHKAFKVNESGYRGFRFQRVSITGEYQIGHQSFNPTITFGCLIRISTGCLVLPLWVAGSRTPGAVSSTTLPVAV
jgi:hypothetical protein